MKTRHIILLALMLTGHAAWAEEANTFYFSDAVLMPGSATRIVLCMRNANTDLTCLEAEIQLPEGLTPVCDETGSPVISLYDSRASEHEVLSNVLDNGNIKFLISSIEGALFKWTDGPLLSFGIRAEADAPTGECFVETVGESLLVSSTAEAYYSVGVTGNVLITDDPTGINLNDNLNANDEAIYNLAGQRVGKARGGIFIKNGKKELHR